MNDNLGPQFKIKDTELPPDQYPKSGKVESMLATPFIHILPYLFHPRDAWHDRHYGGQ